MKTFRCTLEVRGYELDGYNHVNNAVYVSYFEHARWQMLREAGITRDKFDEWKRWPVIARLEINYLRPTYPDDRLDVRSRIVENGRASFVVEQEIFRGETRVCAGKVQVVITDERGRPASIPEAYRALWAGTEGDRK